MDYPYTINDIKTATQVSLQSLYTLIKKNSELIKENSIRKQRKIYYNQTAMDFFISYYSEQAPKTPQKAEEPSENKSSASFRIEALEAERDALQAEIGTLKKQLEAKETERLELLRQNGALLLMLQQEKQEKMLFLPAPKKSFSEKVKSIFKSKPQEKQHSFSLFPFTSPEPDFLPVVVFLPIFRHILRSKSATHFFSRSTHFFSHFLLIFSLVFTHFFSIKSLKALKSNNSAFSN